MMIKIKNQVRFNESMRNLCSECGFPEHFCKHTIEKEYKEYCAETPITKEQIWQLNRSYAIVRFEKENIWNSAIKEIQKLRDENSLFKKENEELKNFKKHINQIIELKRGEE